MAKNLINRFRLKLIALICLVVWPLGLAAQSETNFRPDDETCLTCHEAYDTKLAKTSHRLSSDTKKPAIKIGCGSCHEGGSVHAEDPTTENITNPSNTANAEVIKTCTQCHLPHAQMGTVAFDPHLETDLTCTSCHSIHGGVTSLLLDENGAFCGQCHVSAVNEFRQRSNHPLTDGNITCFSCHDFTGRNSPNFGHGGNANCYQCHPEQSGPYRFEHEAASSFSTEGEGCTTCHFPHGSPNERLLVRPDNTLCRQCHGLPPAHLTTHDGIGASYACLDCHSAVHGSHENDGLLDPQLGTKIGDGPGSCFCHNVTD
ncbi:MAG TPA: cytochrome c3 family protein [Candidatus Deferrimicrobium sp.]|nr:cytochrome c3 family protein [Candidatus Deferrimicrobium sp.]